MSRVFTKTNFNLPKEPIYTVGANNGNRITKEYYDFLVGQINRGTMYRAVCRVELFPFNSISYHLISL